MSQNKYDKCLRCLISKKYHTLPGKRESEIEELKSYNNNSIVKCLERISVIYYNQQKPPLPIKLCGHWGLFCLQTRLHFAFAESEANKH